MKKNHFYLLVLLISMLSVPSLFAQNITVTDGVSGNSISEKADFSCPGSSVFSYPSVGSNGGQTSDASYGWKCFQSFSGATAAFSSVTIWVWHPAPASTRELLVEVYEPGPSPTVLLSSTITMVDPVDTGVTESGYMIYSYTIDIPVTNIADGWISVQATSGGSPTFYWQNTYAIPSYPALQNGGPTASLGMCLGEAAAPVVPLSNWAFALIGILGLSFLIFKFRK